MEENLGWRGDNEVKVILIWNPLNPQLLEVLESWHDVRIANWLKIANWYENCKMIWKLQSKSHDLVESSYVDVCNFHTKRRHSGNESFFLGTECFGWIAAWMTKTQREQSLAKLSTISMLIEWFYWLCSAKFGALWTAQTFICTNSLVPVLLRA